MFLWHGSLAGILDAAKHIIFNNTDTSLKSTNVQDAIAELSNDLAKIMTPTYNYDVEEVIGKTSNNEPIYRKRYNETGLSVSNDSIVVDNTLKSSNVKTVLSCNTNVKLSNGIWYTLPLSYTTNGMNQSVRDSGLTIETTGYTITEYNVEIVYIKKIN